MISQRMERQDLMDLSLLVMRVRLLSSPFSSLVDQTFADIPCLDS